MTTPRCPRKGVSHTLKSMGRTLSIGRTLILYANFQVRQRLVHDLILSVLCFSMIEELEKRLGGSHTCKVCGRAVINGMECSHEEPEHRKVRTITNLSMTAEIQNVKDVRDIELASLRIAFKAQRGKLKEYEERSAALNTNKKSLVKAYKVISTINNNKLGNAYIGSYFAKPPLNLDVKEEMVHHATMIWKDTKHHDNNPTSY
jgi:hypothetical protein